MTPKRPRQDEPPVDAWLMSYADMITLLLAFFIVFVSISEPKQDRLNAAAKGMRDYFSGFDLDSPFDGAVRDIQGIVASHNAEGSIAAEKTAHGLKLELLSGPLFAPGSADLLGASLPELEEIAGVLSGKTLARASIGIESYADADNYADSWQLGALRAARIASILQARGIAADRLSALSYGAARPLVPEKDAAGNLIPENRARNSRIVIRVELP